MKILVKAVAGSHLFGTNTETSDKDFKGVFIPNAEQILLGNYSETVRHSTGDHNIKNTKDDTDVELYSLKKFFKMIENGDTAALELLFTPNDYIIEKTKEWDEIVAIRDTLLSKKVNSLIGYIRQQSNKYGLKGSRMGDLNGVIKDLKAIEKQFDFVNPKLKHNWEEVVNLAEKYTYVNLIELTINNKEKGSVPALDILGKRFSWDTPFPVCIKSLSDTYKAYGQRAREAANNSGVDWKAISHCLRCAYQGIELMQTGRITLPHPKVQKDYLVKVKTGQIKYVDIEPIIEDNLKKLEDEANKSLLPNRLEQKYLDSILLKYYYRQVKEFDDKEKEELERIAFNSTKRIG